MRIIRVVSIVLVFLVINACGANVQYMAGTKIIDNKKNKEIIVFLESYRNAMEQKDTVALLQMASTSYVEDAGTAVKSDDYGYEGLKDVLAKRMNSAESIRYSLKYLNIRHMENRVLVDVLIDASFTIKDVNGDTFRKNMRDNNQIVLEYVGYEWKIISGM